MLTKNKPRAAKKRSKFDPVSIYKFLTSRMVEMIKEPFSIQTWRDLFIVCGISFVVFANVMYWVYIPPSREVHYLTDQQVVEEIKKERNGKEDSASKSPDSSGGASVPVKEEIEKAKASLQRIYDGKLTYYQNKITQFYTAITFTLIFCILGIIVLLLPDGNIPVPFFPEIKIPNYITYLAIPACLCYTSIQFGFFLHHLIEARAALMNLINAQITLTHPDSLCTASLENISIYGKNCYKYYYSLTGANDLKDTGFLDSWFLAFLPGKWFPTAPLHVGDMIVPWITLVAIGILYGISNGLQIGLIMNWIPRFAHKFNEENKPESNIVTTMLPIILLFFVTLFFVVSQIGFYYTGKNRNWVQIWIVLITVVTFWIVTRKDIREFYKKSAKGEKDDSRFPWRQ
jgi:hypothetical protein